MDNSSNSDNSSNETSTGILNGHEWVELGLSVKWATCNIGASNPTEYGGYFSWGGTYSKKSFNSYDCSTYYKSRNELKSGGYIDNDFNLTTKYDAANFIWNGTWRVPTYQEISELKDKCKWTYITQNNVVGYLVTGPNGNSIFLPAAGHIVLTELRDAGTCGSYWSSTPDNGVNLAYRLGFNTSDNWIYSGYLSRECGAPIRAVTE
jgi:hypothetical protein